MIEMCRKAGEANRAARYRRGNVIHLPAEGQVILTGDLHGHRRNFERIVAYADLARRPDRHVVLHEILHGGPEDGRGGCLSFELFAKVLEYQLEFPDRVHLVMGNHDTAIITDSDVMKAGKEMNRAMKEALRRRFDEDYDDVRDALREVLLSQALAVRCPNGIWFSHSLPACRTLDHFDTGIFERPLTVDDCVRPGSAYLLTWGRRQSRQTLETLARRLEVELFVVGHQPQESGWARVEPNMLILASEHTHGMLLPVDLDRRYTLDELTERLVPLASIA
ncbi:MAG TPA: hypothetical protein ENO19_01130 [Halothiobacillaceae bacterium]|nr:hypothetical protein [Halothiobacillaceae bacterium]